MGKDILNEFWRFVRSQAVWWLIPLGILLVVGAGILVLCGGGSPLSPFLYREY